MKTRLLHSSTLALYVGFVALSMAVAGCSDDPGGGLPDSAEASIGPQGGRLEANGVSITIPAGALDDEVVITVERTSETTPSHLVAHSPVFRFGPAGTTFNVPVTVEIAFSGVPDAAQIYWTRPDDNTYEGAGGTVVGDVVRAQISHFSLGFAGSATDDCGNDTIDAGEQCDGSDLGTATCSGEGFAGGLLSCDSSCQLDVSGCTAQAVCGDGQCTGSETNATCPADCGVETCDLQMSGTLHAYVISQVIVPASSSEAATTGIDLDADGDVDNKLGSINAIMTPYLDPNGDAEINAQIDSGGRVFLVRLLVDGFGDDAMAIAQILRGATVTTPPAFDGNDQLALSPNANASEFLCGDLVSDGLSVGSSTDSLTVPASLIVPAFVPVGTEVNLILDSAYIIGTTTEAGWTEVILAGMITPAEVQQVIYPLIADGSVDQTAIDLFDNNCDTSIPGCNPLPSGCIEDSVVHTDEIRCSALLNSAFAPDVDIDNDGVNDGLSVGIKIVSAVPATIVTP